MVDLLTKRGARRVFAAAAATALVGSFAVGSSVSAQTATTPAVAASIAVVGPVPSGVTGYLVSVTCNNLQGISSSTGVANAGSQTLSALFGTTGGTQSLPFTLNALNTSAGTLGSNCSANIAVQGTANLDKAGFSVSYGGAVSGGAFFFTGSGASFRAPAGTAVVPVQSGTTLAITVSYPQITVTKAVVGDEPVAGFAYPMSIACSNPGSSTVIFIAGGANSIPAGYSAGQLVIGTVPSDTTAFVTGLSGTKYFNGGNTTTLSAASLADLLAGIAAFQASSVVAPIGSAGGFTGTFTLKGGESRSFGINQFPAMNINTLCEVRETDSQGSALGYSSTNGFVTGTTTPNPPLLGVLVNGRFQSALTKMNQTVTVTNTFSGDLIVSKVVTGDPKTNIAAYEISVACDKGGPKETFLLRDRQSKVYTGIAAGVNCLVTETRSDGAAASYTDNSGDNTTDGRVTIKLTTVGCGQGTNVSGSNNCIASVIVTNSYVPPSTTAAPTTAAATTAAPTTAAAPVTTIAAAPVTTAAPPVDAAPAPEVEAEASFTG